MKNTQKKLKAKHFRYLSTDIVQNPMLYLTDFYGYWIDLNDWLKEIDLLVNAGTYPEMACPDFLESGFDCRKMIEQIEVAYVIYRQCHIRKQANPLTFFKTTADYHNFISRWEYTNGGKIDPADTLSKFFSFQSLSEWYTTMDNLWIHMTDRKSGYYDRFGDKIVAIKELLFRLACALHAIYKREGIPISVPSYFIAEPQQAHEGNTRSKPA